MAWNSYSGWNVYTDVPATTITAVTSSRGADIATADETITITVADSTGITSATINGVALTSLTIVDATTVTATVPRSVNVRYGNTVSLVVYNPTASAGYTVTSMQPSGMSETYFTVDYAGLNVNSPFYNDPDFSDILTNDSCIYDYVTKESGIGITMSGDGVFTLSSTSAIQESFDLYIYDASDNTGGPTVTITVEAAVSQTITADSIISVEVHGTPTVTAGSVTLVASEIVSEESFGTSANVSHAVAGTIQPEGLASVESFGTVSITTSITLVASEITSSEIVEQVVISQTVSITSVNSEETFDAVLLTTTISIQANEVISEEAFDTPALIRDGVIQSVSIDSTSVFGVPTLIESTILQPTSFISVESFGTISVTQPPDTVPDQFVINDANNVELNTLVESTPFIVTGINVPTTISVTGGEYSINGGAYTAVAGTVNNGDSIRVRGTSSGTNLTSVSVVLDIGGVTDSFDITTKGVVTGSQINDLLVAQIAQADISQAEIIIGKIV